MATRPLYLEVCRKLKQRRVRDGNYGGNVVESQVNGVSRAVAIARRGELCDTLGTESRNDLIEGWTSLDLGVLAKPSTYVEGLL